MKLTDIFTTEELTEQECIEELVKVVNKARLKYGNTDAEITEPEINTVNGIQDLSMLSNESKLELAESEVNNIKTVAVEFTKSYEGAILDRKIEELIAISPLLANIAKTVDSEYI